LASHLVCDHKRPALKSALLALAVGRHFARNHSGVLPSRSIGVEFVTLRIGYRLLLAYRDIEKNIVAFDEKGLSKRMVAARNGTPRPPIDVFFATSGNKSRRVFRPGGE
jgi:hypothetical protein